MIESIPVDPVISINSLVELNKPAPKTSIAKNVLLSVVVMMATLGTPPKKRWVAVPLVEFNRLFKVDTVKPDDAKPELCTGNALIVVAVVGSLMMSLLEKEKFPIRWSTLLMVDSVVEL